MPPLVIDADVAAALAALRQRAIAWAEKPVGQEDWIEASKIIYELTSPQFDVLNQERT